MMPETEPDDNPASACVLLVEDESLIRSMLADELRDTGLRVVESASADEAWRYLENGGAADLVFSDVTMPGPFNGMELARRIHRDFPHIKTLLASGNPGAMTLSAQIPFIQKPYRLDQVIQAILRLVRPAQPTGG